MKCKAYYISKRKRRFSLTFICVLNDPFYPLSLYQVISSSLLALATLLDILGCMQAEKDDGSKNATSEPKQAVKARMAAISFAEKLFSAHKYFLDFLKSQSPTIRSSTYSVLRSYMKNVPHVFNEGHMRTIAPAILGAFHEKDPACHSSMWDAILLFSKTFPDSWSSTNIQKTVLNRLWNFLRNGCFGSHVVSYPALILFLDFVPPNIVDGEKFFLLLFQNLWEGRRNPCHDSNAGVFHFFKAFQECFLWALYNASR